MKERYLDMNENYYFIDVNSSLDGLLELLDYYGFDYDFDAIYPVPDGYTEIHIWYYPNDICVLEEILAPYV